MGRPAEEPRGTPPNLICEGGLIRFKTNGLWGMRDGDGATVVRPEHRVLSCFVQGTAWAVAVDGNAWCPIGTDGERGEAWRCQETVYPYEISHSSPEPLHEDRFESSVLWNLAWLDYLSGVRPEAPGWISRFGRRHSVTGVLPHAPRSTVVDEGGAAAP